jgi:glycosyltransferase involved in cell wall biosynthesis
MSTERAAIAEGAAWERCAKTTAGKAVVVALRFSPAFASLAIAYGRLFADLGYAVSFLLDTKYQSFADFAAIGATVTTAAYAIDPGSLDADLAIFCNPAVNNAQVARNLRRRGIEVLYLLHEPVPVRQRLKEGWKEILKLIAARHCSLAMLRQSSAVLVPSACAKESYDRYFAKFNRNVHTLPLIFDDELTGEEVAAARKRRRYFSFLASAIKAHDFDAFVAFAKYAIRRGSAIVFAIATRTDLTAYLSRDAELAHLAGQGLIRIQHGRALSNEEMNQWFLESFCVWNVYKVSTQSGVLARAFMTGTPVIAMRMGSFAEFIVSASTGEFVSSPSDWPGLLNHAETIQRNFPAYCEGCRTAFAKFFHYRQSRDRLALILTTLKRRNKNAHCPHQPALQA